MILDSLYQNYEKLLREEEINFTEKAGKTKYKSYTLTRSWTDFLLTKLAVF